MNASIDHTRQPQPIPENPRIGIIGSGGAFGRWLSRFFSQRMGLETLGCDPSDAASVSPERLLAQCDVLVFSAPIRSTPSIIRDYCERSAGAERGKLWMDLTSIKKPAVEAMLQSQAEVVGLHPMTAPPKAPTLKGRVLVVCEARLDRWRGFVEGFCQSLEGQQVQATPEQHDRIMALVQAMVHATHLTQAAVLRDYAEDLGGLDALLPFRSASFELDAAIFSRILGMNPAIYEDIQFGNPHAAPMLERFAQHAAQLAQTVVQGDDDAREQFRETFLAQSRQAIGEEAIAAGNYTFERIGYLLADLSGERGLSVHLPEDKPGSLRELLNLFELHRISIASIHSSRTPTGEVHFRLGFGAEVPGFLLEAAALAVDASGVGRVLEKQRQGGTPR